MALVDRRKFTVDGLHNSSKFPCFKQISIPVAYEKHIHKCKSAVILIIILIIINGLFNSVWQLIIHVTCYVISQVCSDMQPVGGRVKILLENHRICSLLFRG